MPDLNFDSLLVFFSQYIYQPELVYFWVSVFLLAGSFGFPVPEEIVLITLGLVSYMATRTDLYPPPHIGAVAVNGYVAALVAFLAVIISDGLVYSIGFYLGKRAKKSERLSTFLTPDRMEKIEKWTKKYGVWACGIFRFTPGIRFPGFLSCGMIGIPWYKFLAIDGLAALISVPTQVILVYLYGETILEYFKKFKIVLGVVLGLLLLFFLIKKIYIYLKKK
jgi:membrane protein DedA with SNARE-associated domain